MFEQLTVAMVTVAMVMNTPQHLPVLTLISSMAISPENSVPTTPTKPIYK